MQSASGPSSIDVPPTIDHPDNHGFTDCNKLGKRDGRRIGI
jgi:hypothetical protein